MAALARERPGDPNDTATVAATRPGTQDDTVDIRGRGMPGSAAATHRGATGPAAALRVTGPRRSALRAAAW